MGGVNVQRSLHLQYHTWVETLEQGTEPLAAHCCVCVCVCVCVCACVRACVCVCVHSLLTAVCVHLDGLNIEHKFKLWDTMKNGKHHSMEHHTWPHITSNCFDSILLEVFNQCVWISLNYIFMYVLSENLGWTNKLYISLISFEFQLSKFLWFKFIILWDVNILNAKFFPILVNSILTKVSSLRWSYIFVEYHTLEKLTPHMHAIIKHDIICQHVISVLDTDQVFTVYLSQVYNWTLLTIQHYVCLPRCHH